MMHVEYTHLIPADFSLDSRVWIYQSSRKLEAAEEAEADRILQEFISNWKSHSRKVKGFGMILLNQFIILIADETISDVSGCSTDSSIHILKKIESQLNINLFDRQQLAFLKGTQIELIHLSKVQEALSKNIIVPDSLFFNHSVFNLKDFKEAWIIPINNSWLAKRLSLKSPIEY